MIPIGYYAAGVALVTFAVLVATVAVALYGTGIIRRLDRVIDLLEHIGDKDD